MSRNAPRETTLARRRTAPRAPFQALFAALFAAAIALGAPLAALADDDPGTADNNPPGVELEAGVVEPEPEGSESDEGQSGEGESGEVAEDETMGASTFGTGDGNGNDVNFQQLPDSSFIYDTSIATLATADSYYNNQTVQVTGEVIGDRINAEFDPAHCWITLQATDGSSAQVIAFMTKDMTSGIDTYGVYGKRGTTIQVRGTYYLVCPQHEGVSDIHVETVSIVSAGEVINEPLRWSYFIPGLVLVLLGGALMMFYHYLQERQR